MSHLPSTFKEVLQLISMKVAFQFIGRDQFSENTFIFQYL